MTLDSAVRESRVRRLAQFKHTSIVSVAGVFEASGMACMALAFEEGETLGQWLDRLGRLPMQAGLVRVLAPADGKLLRR